MARAAPAESSAVYWGHHKDCFPYQNHPRKKQQRPKRRFFGHTKKISEAPTALVISNRVEMGVRSSRCRLEAPGQQAEELAALVFAGCLGTSHCIVILRHHGLKAGLVTIEEADVTHRAGFSQFNLNCLRETERGGAARL